MKTLEQKISSKIAPGENGCLVWTGSRCNGYGELKFPDNSRLYMHRYACELLHGPAPDGKNYALHSCDNKACVNPFHLRWGSQAENMLDHSQRGISKTCTRCGDTNWAYRREGNLNRWCRTCDANRKQSAREIEELS